MNTYTYNQQFDSSCWNYFDEDNENTFICGDYSPFKGSSEESSLQTAPSFIVDTTVLLLAGLIFTPMFASMFKIWFPNMWRLLTTTYSGKRTVTIVRGVPGVGKKHYVYDQEKYQEDLFGICNWNDYFKDTDGNHKFDGTMITKAENYSRMAFLDFISREVDRIYVLGYFNEIWSYSDYEKIARMNGYTVKIVELKCEDEARLKHFNKRSQHKVPMSKSKKVFENWEVDPDSVFQEPYLESFPGDCIPSYGSVTKEELDKELDDYHTQGRKLKEANQMKKEDKSDSDSDYDPNDDYESDDSSYEEEDFEMPEYTRNIVDHITKESIDYTESREVRYTCV
jgi:hypothetical protein